ncbi:MAG: hypothetical protein QXD43_01085 [Candidatus Aenigmatarchaeota archaeon]
MYKLIFLIEILAFISISFWAAAMEGQTGGIFGIRKLFGLSADFYIFFLTIPLFLLMVLLIKPELKLFGVLLTGYLIGVVLEDFFWFLINPYYGIQRFNSKNAFWLKNWINLGFEIPLFYLKYFLAALIIWFVFVYKHKETEKIIKLFLLKLRDFHQHAKTA